MVVNKIEVMYGYMIKVDQIRKYLDDLGVISHMNEDWEDEEVMMEYYYDLLDIFNKECDEFGVKLKNFTCCSEKNGEYYVIGVSMGEHDLKEILNGEGIVKLTKDDKNLVKSLPDMLKSGKSRQFLMVDDCLYCS